jgi:multiple RNA-binding domain-containing protein 1
VLILFPSQISDITLPVSRKAQREQAQNVQRNQREAEGTTTTGVSPLKRKRSIIDESDPKLQEFLEIMQPKSKTGNWQSETSKDRSLEEPPTKIQAIEVPEGESDDEYEMVPKTSKVAVRLVPPIASEVLMGNIASPDDAGESEQSPEDTTKATEPLNGLNATDDDWLRSRTSRLLDLVDPKDIATPSNPEISTPNSAVAPTVTSLAPNSDMEKVEIDTALTNSMTNDDLTPDPIAAAISVNGRLFVRNLPYSASEDDLRQHFEPYGTLEEVWMTVFLVQQIMLYDEYPDRDSLCFRTCDVNWTNILVDASYFLKAAFPMSRKVFFICQQLANVICRSIFPLTQLEPAKALC